MARINVYAGATLDRVALRRGDSAWLSDCLLDPQSRYVALWRGLCLVHGDDPVRAALLAPHEVEPLADDGALVALLGIENGTAHFVVDLSLHGDNPAAGPLSGRGTFSDLREIGGLMPASDAAMLAHARGLMNWHARHLYCGACGSLTEMREAGHLRVCSNPDCATQHFPRTDPAVIMVISDCDRCLLGRQANWPAGIYSCLAGFVEPGESFEESVAREIREEVGIEICDVRYHSSQPWPFPASIMIGFHAHAATTELAINRDELDDARSFDRDDLVNPSEDFRLPRPVSISRRLLEDWITGAAG